MGNVMKNKNVQCDDISFAILINGFHKHGDIETAQSVFDEAVKQNKANKDVLEALSRMNNDKKLKQMKRRKNAFLDIAMDDDVLSIVDVWRMIKFILLKMRELDIERNVVIYGLLFHLCGDAFGAQNCKYRVGKSFYNQMIAENVQSSSLCYHNFLKVGLCHFSVLEPDKHKKEEFAQWILSEMKKYKISISSQHRLTLRAHDIEIVDYGGMLEANS